MSATIRKIRLINFKRFKDFTIEPNNRINIFIGNNEVGKSSILEAIDLVSSGNFQRVGSIGLDKLLNIEAVKEFNSGDRKYENLPSMIIELYLDGDFNFTTNGKNNSEGVECDGIRLVCTPNPDYRTEIESILLSAKDSFPYDFYQIRFSTFADEAYTGYKRRIHSVLIDSSIMNSEYATNNYVRSMYEQCTEDNIKERIGHRSSYRQIRKNFQGEALKDLNERIYANKSYTFGLKGGSALDLESDLMIYENDISIDSKGTGKQVFIKTDFALDRAGKNIDVILIEEPENHLSPVNLRKLVQRIINTRSGQLFITTHNNLISTRLELNNLFIMPIDNTDEPIALKDISKETARYFRKAPPASIVEFALSDRILLVEGPSEYMLLETFYQTCTGHAPEEDGVHFIDIRGLSFKRYLEVAKLTGCKVGVITDNDSNGFKNCVEKYKAYTTDSNIEIFYEPNDSKRTFEVVLYEDNKVLCDNLFNSSALDYMLKNKTDAAYTLLSQEKSIKVPEYIKRAIEWIKE